MTGRVSGNGECRMIERGGWWYIWGLIEGLHGFVGEIDMLVFGTEMWSNGAFAWLWWLAGKERKGGWSLDMDGRGCMVLLVSYTHIFEE